MIRYIEQDEGWNGFTIGCVLIVFSYALAVGALWLARSLPG
jgi:hypothetical protein